MATQDPVKMMKSLYLRAE